MHFYKGLNGNSATRRVKNGDKGKVVKGIQEKLTNTKYIWGKKSYGNM